jgi:hypothetical protein
MNVFTKTLFVFCACMLLLAGVGKVSAQAPVGIDTKASYTLTNAFLGGGVALDGVGANKRPAMKTANGSPLQQWQFADLGNGYYRMTCVGVGSGAALEGGAKDQGAVMNGVANQNGQMWRALDAGNGNVFLVNMFTEKDKYALEGGSLNGGALLTPLGYSGQAWKLTKVSLVGSRLMIGGIYSFQSVSAPTMHISYGATLGRAGLALANKKFRVVAPLNGKADYVSLQPVDIAGDNYLVQAEGCPRPYTASAYYNVAAKPAATDATFNENASFYVAPARSNNADVNLLYFATRNRTHMLKREQGVLMDAPGACAPEYFVHFDWKLIQN